MATPADNATLTMDGWPLGVNNRIRQTEPGKSTSFRDTINTSLYLREAVNVDLTRLGHPLRRKGYTQITSGYTHSLWGDPAIDYGLCVHEGWLCKVLATGDVTQLREVHAYARVSYAVVNQQVFWSNGLEMGRVDEHGSLHWSLPEPPAPVLTAVAGGSLADGEYKVATVYVDEFDEEFGASDVAVKRVEATQQLQVFVPGGWPEDAVAVRVFVSQPNSEILYEVSTVQGPGNVNIHPSMLGKGRELETQDLKQPKPGRIVRYFNGRVYIAHNDTVLFTEALRYGLTRPAQGIYMFPSNVVLLEPVADGVFVGTKEGVVFINGTDPYDVVQQNVLSHEPVPNAVTRVPGEFMEAGDSTVPVWWSADGAMVAGLPGGKITQLSKDRLAVPGFSTGALLYREQRGMAQVVSALSRGSEQSGMSATDSVVTEVRRNTKKLN